MNIQVKNSNHKDRGDISAGKDTFHEAQGPLFNLSIHMVEGEK